MTLEDGNVGARSDDGLEGCQRPWKASPRFDAQLAYASGRVKGLPEPEKHASHSNS